MLELTLIGVSAASFALCIWLLVRLADGAPRRERRIWLLLALAMGVGLVGRGVMAYRAFGHGMDAPLGLQLTLITNPLTVSIVLAFITPILRTYRVAEARRQAAESAFQRSLDDARDAIAILDRDLVITYANSAACALVQRPTEQVVGRPGREFVGGLSAEAERAPSVLEGQTVQIEREIVRADGSIIPAECDLVALGDGRVLVVARDMTPRREAEANRVRAERSAASQALASSIGSDLRDALSFVQSSLELTMELGSDRVPLAPAISATSAALDVLDEFLTTSPTLPERPDLTASIDLRLVVTDAVSAAGPRLGERTSIDWEPPAHPVWVRIAESEVALVVGALLANADAAIRESVAAFPAGTAFRGRIGVRLEESPAEADCLSEARIIIEDNGGGLSPEVRAHMFEPLGESLGRVSRHLGLGATHARVLRLGGSMTSARRGTGGTSVIIRLPGAQ